jgi:hypothetical protein
LLNSGKILHENLEKISVYNTDKKFRKSHRTYIVVVVTVNEKCFVYAKWERQWGETEDRWERQWAETEDRWERQWAETEDRWERQTGENARWRQRVKRLVTQGWKRQ